MLYICVPFRPNGVAYNANLKLVRVIDRLKNRNGDPFCEIETLSATERPQYIGVVTTESLIPIPYKVNAKVKIKILQRLLCQKYEAIPCGDIKKQVSTKLPEQPRPESVYDDYDGPRTKVPQRIKETGGYKEAMAVRKMADYSNKRKGRAQLKTKQTLVSNDEAIADALVSIDILLKSMEILERDLELTDTAE